MKNWLTCHHNVCQNWILNDWTKVKWTNHFDNKIMLKNVSHQAFHTIFQNLVFPWQIIEILRINNTSLTKEVKSDFIKLLSNKELDYYFKQHCYKI